jgi:hypothetical protein
MLSLSLTWIFVTAVALLPPSSAQDSPGARNTARASTNPDNGQIKNGVYHSPFFGFSYKIPFGWVDRTKQMREPDDQAKSLVLLSIFERPPEATRNTINSAVVVAAERLSSFSGVKTAADYFSSIKELAEAKGFKPINEPYAHSISARQLVRGDFSKPRGSLTMYQTSLAIVEKGYALSFMLIGGSEDEIEKLVENLSFSRKVETETLPRRPQP